MVEITFSGLSMHMEVKGFDKLWSFKGHLDLPLAHIRDVRADLAIAHGWWHGIRAPGTSIPGVIRAGTFYKDGRRMFWDVHHPEKTIVIELHDDEYDQLIVEVAEPAETVQKILHVLATRRPTP